MLGVAIVVAVLTVVASSLVAFTKPRWLRDEYHRWSKFLAFAGWAALLWVVIRDASAIHVIQDRIQTTPDASLRSVEFAVRYAVRAQDTYVPVSGIFLLASLWVWVLGRSRTPNDRSQNAA